MTGSRAHGPQLGRLGCVLTLLAGASVAPAQQESFVELDPARLELWEGETQTVLLRFGLERELWEQNLVPLFRRPLDLPLELDTRSWQEIPGLECGPRPAAAEGSSFAWNGNLTRATPEWVLREGLEYTVVEVALELRALRAGEAPAELPPAVLRYARATGWETDFLGERVPRGEERLSVPSAPVPLQVRPLPDPPPEVGPVSQVLFGEPQLSWESLPTEARVGEELSLVLRVRGLRPAEDPSPVLRLHPRAAREPAWVERGRLPLPDDGDGLRLRLDLLPRAGGVLELDVHLPVFEPAEGRWQLATLPLRLPVRGAVEAAGGLDGPRSETSPARPPVAPGQTLPVVFGWLLGAVLLGWAARAHQTMRRRVAEREAGPGGRPLAAADQDPDTVFRIWLAAHLGCSPAALTAAGADLEARLQLAGAPATLAAQTARYLHEAEAARYGGPPLAEGGARREDLRRAWAALPARGRDSR